MPKLSQVRRLRQKILNSVLLNSEVKQIWLARLDDMTVAEISELENILGSETKNLLVILQKKFQNDDSGVWLRKFQQFKTELLKNFYRAGEIGEDAKDTDSEKQLLDQIAKIKNA